MLYSLVRPLLFQLSPETAHEFTLGALNALHRVGLSSIFAGQRIRCAPTKVMGLSFPNPVGLAAGMDKDGAYVDALGALGFGFIEIGTVTLRPQPGNPKPRLFRIRAASSIINRMGFNNVGVDKLVANVRRARYRGVVGINIGKNVDTPLDRAAEEYVACLRAVYDWAGYVAVNVSSPNTKDLRKLQGNRELERLLSALKSEQSRLARDRARYVPIALKIAPDLDPDQLGDIATLLLEHGIDGVIATNTTVSRDFPGRFPFFEQTGGLSGALLRDRATAIIRSLAELLHGRIPIIGVGGISSGRDALEKMSAGASLVQLYTGLIFQGPELVPEILRTLCPQS